MARRRGGYQRPTSPATSSGPGPFSARTDGGPADTQPLRAATGQDYGDRKAILDQQRGAPLPDNRGGQAGGQGTRPAPVRSPDGIFGPTTRPNEPMTAGVPFGPGSSGPTLPVFDDDVEYRLRAIIAANPHLADHLLRLVRG